MIQTEKIAAQREGGKKLGIILNRLLAKATIGISLLAIEEEAVRLIKESGGTPSFQTVEGYKWATCLCVNDEVVHGVPKEYALSEGDVLTIDVGMLYRGYHTDTAWTKVVSGNTYQVSSEIQKFLEVGEKTLWDAIAVAKEGNRIGHISQVIQQGIEGAGYSVVKTLVGHAVGKALHEKPQIPGYLKGTLESTLVLETGMTYAIEVIYARGSGGIVYVGDDGWTLGTRDRSLSAVFEHTILINETQPEVLTGQGN